MAAWFLFLNPGSEKKKKQVGSPKSVFMGLQLLSFQPSLPAFGCGDSSDGSCGPTQLAGVKIGYNHQCSKMLIFPRILFVGSSFKKKSMFI